VSDDAAIDMAVDLCKRFEGFRAKPYLCPAGVPTIGYGATRYLDGRKVTLQDKPISESDAESMLRLTVQGVCNSVAAICPHIYSVGLLAACTSLAFNIGINAFKSSTLRRVVNERGDAESVASQFRRWNRGGGKVLQGLVNRREAEIKLFLN